MTTHDHLGVLRRRWYVAVLGTALLMGAVHVVASKPGVYWTQVDVVIISPKSERYPNVIEQTSQSLIAMAGLVAHEMNRGITQPATASAATTLAGVGVRDGSLVRVPNNGGQWADSFDRPVVDIQVVGPSESVVRAKLATLVADVDRTLAARQAADGIPLMNRITASPAPTAAAVLYLHGSSRKAVAVTLVLAGGLIVTGTAGADRLLNTYARRRRAVVPISLLKGIA